VSTTCGIILAAAVSVLHPQPIHQSGVSPIHRRYKAVADRYLDNHSSAEVLHMNVPMVFGNQVMDRLAAPETATLEKHGHWNGGIRDCAPIHLVCNVGTNVTGVAVLMHHVSKIGGISKISAVPVRPVLDFKLPVPTV
jgi:hypothetical protein